MSDLDRLAMAPPEDLGAYGVTKDNCDLLNPGPVMREICDKRRRQLRATKFVEATGVGSVDELRAVLRDVLDMVGE